MIRKVVIYVSNIKNKIMELNLKDRVLVLNSVLPQYDTRRNLELKMAIDSKMALTTEEQKNIVMKELGNGQMEIGFKTPDTEMKVFVFTDDELFYLKQRVDYIDRNGMFSADTLPTYMKILDELFVSEEYTARWEQASSNGMQ